MNSKYRPNLSISEFKCDLNSNRFSSKTCNVFRVIIILYTIDLYVEFIPQSESKYNKIVSMQTMSNPKILCLPPIANTLRDLDMRFTWVLTVVTPHHFLPGCTQIGVMLNDVTSFPAKIAYKAISSTLQKYLRAYEQLAHEWKK